MRNVPESISQKLPHLPETPGVYLWKGADGTVLYVGKAKRLRSRVRSYVGTEHAPTSKTRVLMEHAVDLETIVVPEEEHALILEHNLIKEHHPRFNVMLRDDKTYPYVKVTVQEVYPRVLVTRRVLDDGARYYGPFTDVGAMRHALNVVKRVFTVRSCRWNMPAEMPERACLDYHIKRCKGPCIGAQSVADYQAMIGEVVAFLDGKPDEVTRRVRQRMEAAASDLDFERAAELRDALRHLERFEEPAIIVDVEGNDRDVLGFARDGDDACVTLLKVRGGKLLARDQRFLEQAEGEPDATVLAAYLAGSYRALPERPAELLLPFAPEDLDLLEPALRPTRVLIPQRGLKRELLDLAEKNARHLLEEFKLAEDETEERAGDPVYELGRALGLAKIPRALVCFDNSTAQGKDSVGSVVWFENGRPRRSEYRTMRVKSVDEALGPDDFASMREVVGRYFRRRVDEGKPLPDLVVVDGGKGQLGAAHEALAALALSALPLVSLAKREEEVFVHGRAEPLRLSRRSAALRLLQQARDEAHRTAVGYNRKRRSMRTITSALLEIPGVGPAKRRELLRAFGSVEGVRAATVEQVAALKGFSAKSAAALLEALRATAPDRAHAPEASDRAHAAEPPAENSRPAEAPPES
ncbi:MAG: excinuclease ABC subunit UvrC [Gemmatimonadetes bacterium]|nr:excinuclease ABC subunit UvrC [Gemmatimonadota bacterium]